MIVLYSKCFKMYVLRFICCKSFLIHYSLIGSEHDRHLWKDLSLFKRRQHILHTFILTLHTYTNLLDIRQCRNPFQKSLNKRLIRPRTKYIRLDLLQTQTRSQYSSPLFIPICQLLQCFPCILVIADQFRHHHYLIPIVIDFDSFNTLFLEFFKCLPHYLDADIMEMEMLEMWFSLGLLLEDYGGVFFVEDLGQVDCVGLFGYELLLLGVGRVVGH